MHELYSLVFSRFEKVADKRNRFRTRNVKLLEVCKAARSIPVKKQNYKEQNRDDAGRMSEFLHWKNLVKDVHRSGSLCVECCSVLVSLE